MGKKIDRRSFLKSASAATTGLTIMKSHIVFGTSANSAVNMGIIGCGNRGSFVAESFMEHTSTRITAIADLFEDRLMAGKKRFN